MNELAWGFVGGAIGFVLGVAAMLVVLYVEVRR